ncbi:TRAP transporter small permease [Pseudaestuariivita rosea]|uniref:TRAP transporter small permease n=1 Tax=Pseudaestuariivita rosea TaxID=2763263 RepID=UPI001ABA0E6B|nr:TRAP transporter small permease subunit [Pseudaestuariivita rosea]
MALLFGLLTPLQLFNDFILRISKALAALALLTMVFAILAQVFFRYLGQSWLFDQIRTYIWAGMPNGALSWSEGAALFLMVWMIGLIAPMAYRYGGFVSVDILERILPRLFSAILTLILMCLAMVVIIYGIRLGWDNINSLMGRGTLSSMSSLRIPLDWVGGESLRFRNWWAFLSLFIGFCLMFIVNLELILRQIITILGGQDRLKPLAMAEGAD